MSLSITKGLFSLLDSSVPPQIAADSLNEHETYHHYGTRICGIVSASPNSLVPYLQQIFNSERRTQVQDQNLQQQKRNELQSKLNDINGKIQSERAAISKLENDQMLATDKLSELKQNLSQAKAKDGEINKMAKAKMIIELIIIAILTVYLFIFYSATFYSAFLFQPSEGSMDISLGTAMFNSSALSDAWGHGFGEFLFIATAPIIFLGLGYSLHFFMVQKSLLKWIKVLFLFSVTLAFDCILAYKIGNMIYEITLTTSWGTYEPYTIKMALLDINSWAVVFCGFIVYVIWGIVFDMVMTAYENLRSNQHEIRSIHEQIIEQSHNIANFGNQLTQKQSEINSLEAQCKTLSDRMASNIFINEHKIKACLSDFFAGWIGLMPALGCSQGEQDEAQNIYNQTISTLFIS